MKQKDFSSKIVKDAMKYAKYVSLSSDYPQFKLGASIFTSKKVLVSASNQLKTCPMQYTYNKFRNFDGPCSVGGCHAEMGALIRLKHLYPNKCPGDLSIFIYRQTKGGQLAMARPCAACEKALRDYGIKHIYYTGRNSLVYEEYQL